MREYWAGIRALRKDYAPQPYNRKYREGKIVTRKIRAETAARHLAEEQLGFEKNGDKEAREGEKWREKEQIISGASQDKKYTVGKITIEELNKVLKK